MNGMLLISHKRCSYLHEVFVAQVPVVVLLGYVAQIMFTRLLVIGSPPAPGKM